MKKQLNFRNVFPALIVEVLEGNGEDIPFQVARYVITDDSSIIGKVDMDWQKPLGEIEKVL